jgi:hypothetical protein
MMPQFLCASLSSLAKLLRERHDMRSKMILRNFPDEDLLTAEYEIIRIIGSIARHRRRCSHCKVRESLTMLCPQRQSFPMDIAS